MSFSKFIFIYELTKTHNDFLLYKACARKWAWKCLTDINQYFYTITNIG